MRDWCCFLVIRFEIRIGFNVVRCGERLVMFIVNANNVSVSDQ